MAKQNTNILWPGNSFTGLGELCGLEKAIINTCDTSLNVVSSHCAALRGQGLDAQYSNQAFMDSVRSRRVNPSQKEPVLSSSDVHDNPHPDRTVGVQGPVDRVAERAPVD
jgi:hypothetical protein